MNITAGLGSIKFGMTICDAIFLLHSVSLYTQNTQECIVVVLTTFEWLPIIKSAYFPAVVFMPVSFLYETNEKPCSNMIDAYEIAGLTYTDIIAQCRYHFCL